MNSEAPPPHADEHAAEDEDDIESSVGDWHVEDDARAKWLREMVLASMSSTLNDWRMLFKKPAHKDALLAFFNGTAVTPDALLEIFFTSAAGHVLHLHAGFPASLSSKSIAFIRTSSVKISPKAPNMPSHLYVSEVNKNPTQHLAMYVSSRVTLLSLTK